MAKRKFRRKRYWVLICRRCQRAFCVVVAPLVVWPMPDAASAYEQALGRADALCAYEPALGMADARYAYEPALGMTDARYAYEQAWGRGDARHACVQPVECAAPGVPSAASFDRQQSSVEVAVAFHRARTIVVGQRRRTFFV